MIDVNTESYVFICAFAPGSHLQNYHYCLDVMEVLIVVLHTKNCEPL